MHEHAYIARQPIVDRQQKIVGYELHAGTGILANTLNNMGTDWLLGDKKAFINVGHPTLESEFLESLPAKHMVLEILEPEPTPEVLKRCRDFRAKGFTLALDGFEHGPQTTPLLEMVDFVKLDVQQLGPAKTAETVSLLANHALKLIAEKVETKAEFKTCRDMGFDCFQGFYFAHPETMAARVINPTHASVLHLLNQVRNNAEVREIEDAFKRDVALSFKLLRYINSVGFGLSCEIQSIRHAVAILGYPQLYRWLTLLLVTAGNEESAAPALTKTAVTRGRLTELLGQGYLEQPDRDNLFIVGVFSLLDAMLEMPMESVLEKLALPETISDALLLRQGIYGPFLTLAEACEGASAARIEELTAQLQLEPEKVNQAHLEALAWVEKVGI
jgi:EAL and modified HD-GYP domain-containing signal transduction protein